MRQFVIVIITSIVLFILIKKISIRMSPLDSFEKAIEKVKRLYGLSIAKNIERIYRLETDNFKSKQFLLTYSAGMEDHSKDNSFPYGWHIGGFWNTSEGRKYAPIGTEIVKENEGLLKDGGKYKRFLKFKNVESAVMTLAEFLRIYGNNAGRWFSTEPDKQTAYNNTLLKINTLFT